MNPSLLHKSTFTKYQYHLRMREACESEFIHGSMDPEACLEDWLRANAAIAKIVHTSGSVQRWIA